MASLYVIDFVLYVIDFVPDATAIILLPLKTYSACGIAVEYLCGNTGEPKQSNNGVHKDLPTS